MCERSTRYFCLKPFGNEVSSVSDDLPEDLLKKLGGGRKKNKEVEADSGPSDPVSVELKFKRFVFDPKKRMIQS